MTEEDKATPLFFDQKRFLADLDRGNAIQVFRDALEAAQHHFDSRFEEGEKVSTLVSERAHFLDIIIRHAWERYRWESNIALIAVGGYGRGELHPHSDIDLLILLKRNNSEKYRTSIEKFLTFLWDIQLKIGQSVRSIRQCVQEAKADLTVATNLMETRLIWGDATLHRVMLKKTGPGRIWPSPMFYKSKIEEQRARYRKHDFTEYNLEPNIKEAPGGLRDIQLVNWVAKRHFRVEYRPELVRCGFLMEDEYNTMCRDEEFLWRVRYGLHLIAGRPEERLFFDYQRKLAKMFGYQDTQERLGVEKFMQRYYQTVLSIRELNDELMQYLDEAIFRKDKVKVVEPLNERFIIRDRCIDTTSQSVFSSTPSAMLELFAILGENDQIQGIRASALRELRLNRHLINQEFRDNPLNRELFMRILRAPWQLSLQLQRMNRYGILGAYLPEFGKIVGQTQHDLFHIYPVDVHTLQVVRNIRSLAHPDGAQKFPVTSHIYLHLQKPELLIIAALYHDIAKGRGGDHSRLGAQDIADFAQRHGLAPQESELLRWLVENHLLMSSVSQRQDISDPDVIYKFADHVGDMRNLEHLYVLTVADINATNPKLWTDWKGSLMRDLYFETKRVLQSEPSRRADKSAWVETTKLTALNYLEMPDDDKITAQQASAVWRDLGDEFFLRERAQDIADFTRAIINNSDPTQPVILLRDVGQEVLVATQIFIYSSNRQNIFAIAAATLDQLMLNIQDARLHTTSDGHTFDIFYVLNDNGQPIGKDEQLCNRVLGTLRTAILNPGNVRFDIQRRLARQLKHFTLQTAATLRSDTESNTTILEVITPDRPGLLAHLARIFLRFGLRLHNAKITTLGERVEDVFYITDKDYQPLFDPVFCENLRNSICQELDARNQQDRQGASIQQVSLNTT